MPKTAKPAKDNKRFTEASDKDSSNNWWNNRIVSYGEQPANQFLAHDLNARRHPPAQREALRGSLNSVGWVAPVIVSKQTGKLLDGHARVEEALSVDELSLVPFVVVDVSESQERLILASFDPITNQAYYDKEVLDALLREVSTGDAALQSLLSDLAQSVGVIEADFSDAFDKLPTEDRAPFQQMTFTVTDAQADLIRDALKQAPDIDPDETGNENSNGNALAHICEMFINAIS